MVKSLMQTINKIWSISQTRDKSKSLSCGKREHAKKDCWYKKKRGKDSKVSILKSC